MGRMMPRMPRPRARKPAVTNKICFIFLITPAPFLF
ncbi:hypothetical protein N288_05400 [Bacillus infantis NRRL B-14911]|uniref:Uncharacterized protein n=1 Tax=Bacillus infantis NRRL B-14911 TaxID=1367477 RepID=U5L5G8_9BACI|nr:hypothetical protein N288_05400 [Bacillus infantis NRRL B-14911]